MSISRRRILASLTGAAFIRPHPNVRKSVVVRPREIDDLLANPGMGWQTFHRFADEDTALDGLPSGCAYFRFYWREIEPKQDQIDFPKLDSLLAHARRAGQRFAFRVMCTGSGEYMDVPSWLRDTGANGVEFTYEGRRHWAPNWEDPIFLREHMRLIRDLGKRYDGSPDLDLVDIGSIGLWGEWHMSGTAEVETGKPVPMPTPETARSIIDAWRGAFPKTPKVMLIGDEDGLNYATHHGCGWRADCLGDMGGFSKTWNHMTNLYLQQIAKSGSGDAWKIAPVAFESCWDMRKWKEEGWDIRYIFDYALRLHCSYLNNKSAPIPMGTRQEVVRFLRRAGYRLVLRKLEHPATVAAGQALPIQTSWENVGVAPPYHDFLLAFRFTPTAGGNPIVTATRTSVRGWLPGTRESNEQVRLPKNQAAGNYELALGLLDTATKEPTVQLAISGRGADGWYSVSKVEVKAGV